MIINPKEPKNPIPSTKEIVTLDAIEKFVKLLRIYMFDWKNPSGNGQKVWEYGYNGPVNEDQNKMVPASFSEIEEICKFNI